MTTTTDKIRIGLVDDIAVNRSSFVQKISMYEDIELVLNTSNGHEFLESIRNLPFRLLPQLVFMDIEMPGLNGIETIRLAKSMQESIQFIVLTVFEDDENIFDAIQAGASGYLLKHESQQTLHHAILEVLEFGGAPMSPAIARKTLKLLGQQKMPTAATTGNELLETLLSEREREVLHHMVNGYDAKRIGEITTISTLTVRKHISNIYKKLHVNSKAQVISMAHKHNWTL